MIVCSDSEDCLPWEKMLAFNWLRGDLLRGRSAGRTDSVLRGLSLQLLELLRIHDGGVDVRKEGGGQ